MFQMILLSADAVLTAGQNMQHHSDCTRMLLFLALYDCACAISSWLSLRVDYFFEN